SDESIESCGSKSEEFLGIGEGPVMLIVKEDAEPQSGLKRQNCVHHFGVVPLVEQHNIGTAQFLPRKLPEVDPGVEKPYVEAGKRFPEKIDGRACCVRPFLHQIAQRPRINFLVAAHVMAKLHELIS